MLTAEPIAQSEFPRRNWAVLCNEALIGEVTLIGWGTGAIVLRGEHYSTIATPEVNPFVPLTLPRQYKMCTSDAVFHSAAEDQRSIYCVNSPDSSGNLLTLKQPTDWWPFIFRKNWPFFNYGLYRASDPARLGSITRRAFHDRVALNLPAEIVETLQVFLLWLVVDRAQWQSTYIPRSVYKPF